MRLKYPCRKQFKTNYEVEFSFNPMLKGKNEKNQLKHYKKWYESTRVNLPNQWHKSWDWDNLVENKLK
jgi:hypothetical protein